MTHLNIKYGKARITGMMLGLFEFEPIFVRAAIAAIEDNPSQHKSIERKKEWTHGDDGSPNCSRKERPVYTDTNKHPRICRGYACDNEHWIAGPVVTRIKETKQIVHREETK